MFLTTSYFPVFYSPSFFHFFSFYTMLFPPEFLFPYFFSFPCVFYSFSSSMFSFLLGFLSLPFPIRFIALFFFLSPGYSLPLSSTPSVLFLFFFLPFSHFLSFPLFFRPFPSFRVLHHFYFLSSPPTPPLVPYIFLHFVFLLLPFRPLPCSFSLFLFLLLPLEETCYCSRLSFFFSLR